MTGETMYERILIPTDGSRGAKRGAKHALDIAKRYGATVHVLFVVDERVVGATPALSSNEFFIEQCEEAGNQALKEIAAEAEAMGLETVEKCVRNRPSDAILEYAEDEDIDLIVMGIHGTSERRRPHIGSVTDSVVRTAPVPVLPV